MYFIFKLCLNLATLYIHIIFNRSEPFIFRGISFLETIILALKILVRSVWRWKSKAPLECLKVCVLFSVLVDTLWVRLFSLLKEQNVYETMTAIMVNLVYVTKQHTVIIYSLDTDRKHNTGCLKGNPTLVSYCACIS